MPHPRINPAVKGEYIKVGDAPFGDWVKLSDILRSQDVNDAQGPGILFVFRGGKPSFISRSDQRVRIKESLRKKNIDVRD